MVRVREVETKGVGWASEEVSDLVAPPLNLELLPDTHAFENIQVYIEYSHW
jgi:hypothetical protein